MILTMKRPRDYEWDHYPANDIMPEHFSCPFGIVIENNGKWEAWTLNSAYRDIPSADLLAIETLVSVSAFPQYGKGKIQKIAEARMSKLAMKATA